MKLSLSREFFVTFFVAVACLTLFWVIDTPGLFESFLAAFFFFLVVPFFYIRIVLRRPVSFLSFPLHFPYRNSVLSFGLASLVCVFLLVVAFSYWSSFSQEYFVPGFLFDRFWLFLLYEFFVVFPLLFLYEFFFRGFLLFSFESALGVWSIVVQFAFLFFFFLFSDNSLLSVLPIILAAPFAGVIAYLSRCVFYSSFFVFLVVFFTDVFMIRFLS
ncbi:MAG: hypothetical protein KC736_03505 [Candidatus Moranbacteria bacterium]|nr:hypothetical protein [Candidatus Moranbacteria bacterium]